MHVRIRKLMDMYFEEERRWVKERKSIWEMERKRCSRSPHTRQTEGVGSITFLTLSLLSLSKTIDFRPFF